MNKKKPATKKDYAINNFVKERNNHEEEEITGLDAPSFSVKSVGTPTHHHHAFAHIYLCESLSSIKFMLIPLKIGFNHQEEAFFLDDMEVQP